MRLQLFSGEATRMFDTRTMVSRPLSPHLHMFVVEDILGQSEQTLSRTDVEPLGLDDDALFARARANAVVSDQPHVHVMRTEHEGGAIDVFVSNKYYLGALLLTQLEQDGKDALVVLLTWHHALLHVLGEGTSVATIEALAALEAQISTGARCQPMEWLSPEIHLYSASDRSLTPVTLDHEAATLRVTAPASLAARLHGG
ncbi:MAG: hypothetical protein H0T76_15600 [Nannocystis sp.]|nr:hypothetical protein [Nannocystis sp.]MBA3547908.1 hypothetical protein [Nannocystis sp.]